MNTMRHYIGIEPFHVLIDDSPKLSDLADAAKKLRDLPFADKLKQVKQLTLDAMVNAYEQMIVAQKNMRHGGNQLVWKDGAIRQVYVEPKGVEEFEKYKGIVFSKHPLSYALEEAAGCCRYQGALFFALAFEADLGDKHFIQSAPVNERARTVFNDVINEGTLHQVSIFTESLKDKSLDYSRQNPRIFEMAESLPGFDFYSYHRTSSGLVIAVENGRHVEDL